MEYIADTFFKQNTQTQDTQTYVLCNTNRWNRYCTEISKNTILSVFFLNEDSSFECIFKTNKFTVSENTGVLKIYEFPQYITDLNRDYVIMCVYDKDQDILSILNKKEETSWYAPAGLSLGLLPLEINVRKIYGSK